MEDSTKDRIAEAKSADAAEVVEQLVRELETKGIPEGAWLLDIGRARQSLQEADTLLRRLEDAIIRSSSGSPLGGL
jgi:hypothetical protein